MGRGGGLNGFLGGVGEERLPVGVRTRCEGDGAAQEVSEGRRAGVDAVEGGDSRN